MKKLFSFLLLFTLFISFSLSAESATPVVTKESDTPASVFTAFTKSNGLYRSSAVNSFNQVLLHSPAITPASKGTHLIVMEANNTVMKVDGKEKQMDSDSEVTPLTINGTVYAPLRTIVEQFGTIPTYKDGVYTINNGCQTTSVNIFTNEAYINNTLVASEVNSFYHQGYLYLPVDLIARALNKTILYECDKIAIGDEGAIRDYKYGVQIPVLMYHHFDPHYQNGVTADSAVFEQQMILLKEQGYTTLTTQDLIAITKGEQTLPKKPIMITLDDAYESNYQYVYPVLKKLNMKATIFVITSYIEHPEVDNIPIPKMTWDMMKEMSDSGLVSFQSHTNNLHYLAGGKGAINTPIMVNGVLETTAQYEERIYNDLVLSKQILEEKLGKPVTSFAYPKGLYSEASEALLKRAGFELTLTTDKGLYNTKRDTLYLMNRVNVHGQASANSILTTIQKVRSMP